MATLRVQRGGWHEEIDRLVKSLGYKDENGLVTMGSLTITGHDYWVILEYGSSPRTRNPLTHSQRGTLVKINIPDVPRSKNHRSWYPIRPKRRGGRLVYWHRGKLQVRKIVHHPGIAARGFLRRALEDVQNSLYKDLVRLANEDTLPDREELRALLNGHLLDLLVSVRESSPVQAAIDAGGFELDDEDDDGSHLKDAWGVTLSR
jgi:hypothetical protein